MKVYLDPACDILYSSYYIKGLQDRYGSQNVRFSSKYFPGFRHNNHFFAFVVNEQDMVKKVVIDFTDSSRIDETALSWCHVYGKINLEYKEELSKKVVPIGPSFGIRIFSPYQTVFFAITNLIKAFNRIPDKRRFLADYKSQFNRPALEEYALGNSKANYIYYMSSLWKKEPQTNQFRANFIRACQSIDNVEFEGGFAPRTKNDIEGFGELTLEGRISMKQYLSKMKESLLVFNTPAVKGCHGWKLGEFLCMGKAIISTPLSREMPFAFEPMKHYLSTNGSREDVTKKVNLLIKDPQLRFLLEKNSRDYFENQLAPELVITKIIGS